MSYIKYFVKHDADGFISSTEVQEVDDSTRFNTHRRTEIPEFVFTALESAMSSGASFRIVGGDIVEIENVHKQRNIYRFKIERLLDALKSEGVTLSVYGVDIRFAADDNTILKACLYSDINEGTYHITDSGGDSVFISGKEARSLKKKLAILTSDAAALKAKYIAKLSASNTIADIEKVYNSFLVSMENRNGY